MSELRERLQAEVGAAPLASPRDLSQADLVARHCETSTPSLAQATLRGELWNFRWKPEALHELLSWEPKVPSPVPPPALRAAGNLGAARAHALAECLGRLGVSRDIAVAPARGFYLDAFDLVATPPGQPLQATVLSDGHPLERALGRAGRLKARGPLPGPAEMEGLSPAERELLVRLEQFSSVVAGGQPHRLAAWARDLARRLDDYYARVPLLQCGTRLAVFQAAARGLNAAAELLGLSPQGESLCL